MIYYHIIILSMYRIACIRSFYIPQGRWRDGNGAWLSLNDAAPTPLSSARARALSAAARKET